MNGIYGGITNIAPGLMGLWLSKAIASLGLGIAYVIWLVMLAISIGVSIPMIFNSPFHQIMFRRQGQVKKEGGTLSKEELDEIKQICHERHEQDLFPTGSVMVTLKQSAQT